MRRLVAITCEPIESSLICLPLSQSAHRRHNATQDKIILTQEIVVVILQSVSLQTMKRKHGILWLKRQRFWVHVPLVRIYTRGMGAQVSCAVSVHFFIYTHTQTQQTHTHSHTHTFTHTHHHTHTNTHTDTHTNKTIQTAPVNCSESDTHGYSTKKSMPTWVDLLTDKLHRPTWIRIPHPSST